MSVRVRTCSVFLGGGGVWCALACLEGSLIS